MANRRSFAASGIGSIDETQEMLDERVLASDVRYRSVIDASTI